MTPSDRKPWIPPLRLRILALLLVTFVAVGCPCIRGPVNASPGLRWWLFSNFGAQRMCPEMLKRGAPLKLIPTGNTIGRFFPEQCSHLVNDANQTITLNFSGTGFAWTPIAGRVGFAASASVEYRMDFFMAEEAVYIWAKTNRIAAGPDFKMGSIENKLVNWAAQGPAGYMANTFGRQIVESQIASGFTVVHADEGDEFALGHLQPPQRPPRPFDTSDERYVFNNDITEIRNEQIDFLGPYEVADTDQALFMRFRVSGPAIDALVIHRGTGDLWRNGLQLGNALAPPPQPPITLFPLMPGNEQRQKVALPPGQYYVVLDNSSRVGNVNPPWSPLGVVGGNSVIVAYTAELGEADDDF
jgi:hypothetical protein